ncbi:hypothetical protein M0804_014870, partial [Polistes exclamans]
MQTYLGGVKLLNLRIEELSRQVPPVIFQTPSRSRTVLPKISLPKFSENAPLLGVRSKLPEKFHIKNYPLLTYCGLLYHDKSLQTEEEKKTFAEYKISSIAEHIPSRVNREIIKRIVEILPPPSIAGTASLLQTLDLERSQVIIANKPLKFQNAVLDHLRQQETKGPWEESKIQQENAEYQQALIRTGKDLLYKALEDQFLNKRGRI